jgi:hypothetical protein
VSELSLILLATNFDSFVKLLVSAIMSHIIQLMWL